MKLTRRSRFIPARESAAERLTGRRRPARQTPAWSVSTRIGPADASWCPPSRNPRQNRTPSLNPDPTSSPPRRTTGLQSPTRCTGRVSHHKNCTYPWINFLSLLGRGPAHGRNAGQSYSQKAEGRTSFRAFKRRRACGVREVSCRREGIRGVQKSSGDSSGARLLPIECAGGASGPG